MPQYLCKYSKDIDTQGSRNDALHAIRMALLEGEPEDITGWAITRKGPDLYHWTGAVTVSSVVLEKCRRDALRRFLYNLDLPEDVAPGDVVVTEVSAAVELEPAPTAIPVPEGVRAVPRYPDRAFDGLTEASA